MMKRRTRAVATQFLCVGTDCLDGVTLNVVMVQGASQYKRVYDARIKLRGGNHENDVFIDGALV